VEHPPGNFAHCAALSEPRRDNPQLHHHSMDIQASHMLPIICYLVQVLQFCGVGVESSSRSLQLAIAVSLRTHQSTAHLCHAHGLTLPLFLLPKWAHAPRKLATFAQLCCARLRDNDPYYENGRAVLQPALTCYARTLNTSAACKSPNIVSLGMATTFSCCGSLQQYGDLERYDCTWKN
jgi:hypothetical protein